MIFCPLHLLRSASEQSTLQATPNGVLGVTHAGFTLLGVTLLGVTTAVVTNAGVTLLGVTLADVTPAGVTLLASHLRPTPSAQRLTKTASKHKGMGIFTLAG